MSVKSEEFKRQVSLARHQILHCSHSVVLSEDTLPSLPYSMTTAGEDQSAKEASDDRHRDYTSV